MKPLFILAAALALTGCSSFDRLSYGSWLDHVGERKAARYPYTPQESQALQARAAALKSEAEDVRVKLAGEKDRVQRVAYMNRLEDIGNDLRPIERRLRQGGTNSRRQAAPPDYTQAGGQ